MDEIDEKEYGKNTKDKNRCRNLVHDRKEKMEDI